MDASASGMEAFGSEAAIGGHELISSHARITTLDEAYAALGEVLRGWREPPWLRRGVLVNQAA